MMDKKKNPLAFFQFALFSVESSYDTLEMPEIRAKGSNAGAPPAVIKLNVRRSLGLRRSGSSETFEVSSNEISAGISCGILSEILALTIEVLFVKRISKAVSKSLLGIGLLPLLVISKVERYGWSIFTPSRTTCRPFTDELVSGCSATEETS